MRRRRTATNDAAETPAPAPAAADAAPRRRGRRPAAATAEGAAPAAATGTRTRTTRRRRSQAGSETGRLIDALLKSRGAKGATQNEIAQVVSWAQNILAEGTTLQTEAAELRKLGPRGKRSSSPVAAARQKQQKEQRQAEITSRQQRHAMDRALLEGVLAGNISVDVKDGELVFLGGQYAAEHAEGASAEPTA